MIKKRETLPPVADAPTAEKIPSAPPCEPLFPDEEECKRKAKKKIRRGKVPAEGTFEHLTPDLSQGLSAEQVKTRFSQLLFNETGKKYSKSYLGIVMGNLCNYFNLLALVVAIALLYARAPISQYAFALMFALNITVGIVQEIRAKKQIDKLTLVTSPTARVIREGMERDIPTDEIVVDDVILLSTGQQIPVDGVMCDGTAEVNESLLTGESVPVKKKEGDPLYAGSFLVAGNCRARVRVVGRGTYANRLTAKASRYKRPHSEIMHAINLFISIISVLMIPIVVGIVWLNLPQNISEVPETIQTASAVIIGLIPSGMILLTSIAMATGIIRLSQSNTLVNDMYSLEMLARVDVLCLDKTGTITDGRMKVEEVHLINAYSSYSVDDIMSSALAALDDNNQTSLALKERFSSPNPALVAKTVLPFSSARKLSAVTFAGAGTFVYGAPEFVLRPMPARVESMVREYSRQGLRVLVLAYSSSAITRDRVPSILRPVAIIVLSDHIRDDAADTIRWFRENDVQVKVISGDNPVTVSSIAVRAGVENAENYLSLEGLSDSEVEAAASRYTVFGRVTPEQKAVLVKALKKEGHTVAMTGDGVNDILAMKEADCAVSVASGSEAARNVSNLVLMDNNFSNMPKVVHEGRRVINNVKSTSALYIMKNLFTAILAIICICLGRSYLFKTNNLLCFELLVAGIPSIIFSQQPNDRRLTGKFFPYVLCHSLPAAITMILSVMSVYIASIVQFGELTAEYNALAILAVTFTGVVNLYFLAKPLNLLRGLTFAGSLVLCAFVFCLPLTANIVVSGWSDLQFSFTGVLFLVCVVETCVPVALWLEKLFGVIERTLEKNY